MPSNEDTEAVEQACLRLVARAMRDYCQQASENFKREADEPVDIAEDTTREALDLLGASRIPIRLYGKVDYKRAAVIFLPNREIEVALFIDSKAEKSRSTATIQMSQTSMEIRQVRGGVTLAKKGELPVSVERDGKDLQTITIIVKYVYEDQSEGKLLKEIIVACIPSGRLQDTYNPDSETTIWRAGRNAPTRGEEFRVRLSFDELVKKAAWRVARIQCDSEQK